MNIFSHRTIISKSGRSFLQIIAGNFKNENKVGILFYEVGNLKSVANAINKVGYEFEYINNVNEIKNFKK